MWSELLESGLSTHKHEQYLEGQKIFLELRQAAEYKEASPVEQFEVNLQLATALRYTGKLDESNRYGREAMAIAADLDGVDSLTYSRAQQECGLLAYVQHECAESRTRLLDALRIRRGLYGDKHAAIAEVLNHLGDVETKDGNTPKASQYVDQALEMRLDLGMGERDRDYLESLSNKAGAFLKAGKLDEAEATLRKTIKFEEHYLGYGHPLLALSLNNLVVVLLSKGVLNKIEATLNQAEYILNRAYGPDSTYTSVTATNHGHYEQKRGNLQEASKHFLKALKIKEKALGYENRGLIIPLKSLWHAYLKLERLAEAETLQVRIESLMRSQIESSGGKDLSMLTMFADYLFQQRRFPECDEWGSKSLAAAAEQFGKESLRVAEILQFRGSTLMGRNIDSAKECYMQALKIRKKELGTNHSQVAILLRLLAACFTRQTNADTGAVLILQARAIEVRNGMEDAALAARSRLLNQLRDAKGPQDTQVLNGMKQQLHSLWAHNRMAEAKETFWKYIEIMREKNRGDDPALVDEIIFGAFNFANYNDFDSAIEASQKALKIQEAQLGTMHAELRNTLAGIHRFNVQKKDFVAAEETARRLLRITEKLQEEDNMWLRTSLSKLEQALEGQKRTNEAKEVKERLAAVPPETEKERAARQQEIANLMKGINIPQLAALFGMAPPAPVTEQTERDS